MLKSNGVQQIKRKWRFFKGEIQLMNDSHKRPRMDIPKTMSEWVWDIIGFTAYFFCVSLIYV